MARIVLSDDCFGNIGGMYLWIWVISTLMLWITRYSLQLIKRQIGALEFNFICNCIFHQNNLPVFYSALYSAYARNQNHYLDTLSPNRNYCISDPAKRQNHQPFIPSVEYPPTPINFSCAAKIKRNLCLPTNPLLVILKSLDNSIM